MYEIMILMPHDLCFVYFYCDKGCNGTHNIIESLMVDLPPDSIYHSETTVDPSLHTMYQPTTLKFDPILDRHRYHLRNAYDISSRDIKAGEEMYTNYLFFVTDEKEWSTEVAELQDQCAGLAIGSIKQDEMLARVHKEE